MNDIQANMRGLMLGFLAVIVLFILLALSRAEAQGITVQRLISASTVQQSDGYHLVLTGDTVEIARVCTFGNCNQAFATALTALNYWLSLVGMANGLAIVPIPPPPP